MSDDLSQNLTAREEVGYGKPPMSSRFCKGQSGNPKGRPRGARTRGHPYEAVLGRAVTIREDGVERVVTAAEALVLKLAQHSLSHGGGVAQLLAEVLEQQTKVQTPPQQTKGRIVREIVRPGSVTTALELLRLGKVLDAARPTAKMLLEPWIVERALARLGERRLSVPDQMTVLAATRRPKKVRWPDWWQALPDGADVIRDW